MKLKQKMLLGSLIPTTLLVITGYIIYNSITTMGESSKWVDHTHKVIESAMKIEAAAVDMETGMRGYLLAGKEEFLEPYKAGGDKFYVIVENLQKTVSDNPPQVERLGDIGFIIKEWQDKVCEPTIELRRKIGDAATMDDMADEIGKAKGKTYFDKFRSQILTFIQRENDLLKVRHKDFIKLKDNQGVNLTGLNETTKWVDHTHKVIAKAMMIEAAAVDMETGMRGYLLAGKEEFLEPYNSGIERFGRFVKELQKTVDDNPPQVQLLKEIDQNISEWKAKICETSISLRRNVVAGKNTMNEVAELVGQARGKAYFDKFRGQIATFISKEAKLLKQRVASAKGMFDKSVSGVSEISDSFAWVDHTHRVMQSAMEIEAAAVDMETGMRGYLLAGKEEFLEPYNDGLKNFDVLLKNLQKTVSDNPAQVKLLDEINQTITEWISKVVESNIELRRKIGDAETMNDMADLVGEARGKTYFDNFRGKIAEFIGIEKELLDKRILDSQESASQSKTLIVWGVAIITIISVIFSLVISDKIVKPVRQIQNRMELLSEGDLATTISVSSKDELGILSQKFNESITKLSESINLTQNGSRQLSASSQSISSTTTELGNITDEMREQTNAVASATEELSINMSDVSEQANSMYKETVESKKSAELVDSSMKGINSSLDSAKEKLMSVSSASQQMASVISEIAQNTERSRETSAGAVNAVDKASERVNALITSANEIVAITETINDISEQTKTLALNATIEAARAGEAGKGFAVVAKEVKDLAKGTSIATVDISNKIQNMKEATDLTVGEISSIKQVISEINDMISKIATSIEEQRIALKDNSENTEETTGILSEIFEAIRKSISQVNEISERTSIMENAASTVSSIIDQAKQATEEVARNVVTVNDGIASNSDSVDKLKKNASNLSIMASTLQEKTEVFSVKEESETPNDSYNSDNRIELLEEAS